MPRLIVRLKDQILGELDLKSDRSYCIGRGGASDIQLPDQRGISREHVRLDFTDGSWRLRLVARYGSIIVDGRTSTEVILNRALVAEVPPFSAQFIPEESGLSDDVQEPSKASELVPATQTEAIHSEREKIDNRVSLDSQNSEEHENSLTLSRTIVDQSLFRPYLKVRHRASRREELIPLKGIRWVIGRDPTCDIQIEDHRLSRKHIAIERRGEDFILIDLDSSNGTNLNGEAMSSSEELELASGDSIALGDVTILFELRQDGFVPSAPAVEVVEPVSTARVLRSFSPRGHLIRYTILALVGLVLYGLFIEDDEIGAPQKPPSTKQTELASRSTKPFGSLSLEEQRTVRDSFNLIKNLYVQGKYELCLSELERLHAVTDHFENSQELYAFCKNGSELVLKEREIERERQAKAENEAIIQSTAADCERSMSPKTTVEDIRKCLQPAIERDPNHALISDLEAKARSLEEAQLAATRNKEAHQKMRAQGLNLLESARRARAAGRLADAVQLYERFLRGSYPVEATVLGTSERELASVRQSIDQLVKQGTAECTQVFESKDFGSALIKCGEVLKINPRHEEALRLSERARMALHSELKSLYEDSVIEESMGNVDGAKERWKQILNRSIPTEEYYKKAKKRLDRYGAGE